MKDIEFATENRSSTISVDDSYHYNVGDRVTMTVRRNGFWVRLWYMVFFGYVPMKNEMLTVTQVDSGTTISLDNICV